MNEPDAPSPLHDLATWAPLLNAARRDGPVTLTGRVQHHLGRALATVRGVDDPSVLETRFLEAEVPAADEILLEARIDAAGHAELDVIEHGPAFRDFTDSWPSRLFLLLVDGAEAEPRRRTPAPAAVGPAPGADPELLERTLRERLGELSGDLPGGVDEARLAAAEARLGIALPAELRTLMGLLDHLVEEPWDTGRQVDGIVGCELFGLDGLFLATTDRRPGPWPFSAATEIGAPTGTAVQGLVGSPGWIGFGTNGGDIYAVDLTPGPGGHLGQVILLSHELEIGADLVADSLTDFVLGRHREELRAPGDGPPQSARAADRSELDLAARPELQVLHLQGPQLPLGALRDLPGLRTLTAVGGALADPTELRHLAALEYLELDAAQWRTLLDADALPPGLLAASVRAGEQDRAVARDLLARYGRPQPRRSRITGRLAR
ncbi:SMI1/KNR4 family protein [Kitasatospora sp. NPDC088391]|uniref:SMI1/KNR4 family protein n=1 Tax=Kitasatospora sp. NPDC088391 TaxID=3364074 RepID=UPI00382983AA